MFSWLLINSSWVPSSIFYVKVARGCLGQRTPLSTHSCYSQGETEEDRGIDCLRLQMGVRSTWGKKQRHEELDVKNKGSEEYHYKS